MRHIVLVLTLLVVGTLGYQMRYRVLNLLFGNSFIRSLAVRSFFNLPFVRDRLMKQVFR
ncbi:hypothetical protein [Priestia aryabhattai]|uniref:hypothetical protein n=1 Tax=Priestia aryabhattai TaxID=412384 RepID=UPI003D2895A4